MVALAMQTGIPVATWLCEPAGVLDTALALMNDSAEASAGRHRRSDGPQMSG